MSESFHVGPWRVEPPLLRLTRGEETRSLPPRAMDLLAALAARRGQVVTREELHQQVWNGDAVGEDVLRRTVFELRRTLDDDARAPRFVETVPRRGYRLLPAAEPHPERPPSPVPEPDAVPRALARLDGEEPPELDARPRGRRRGSGLLLAVLGSLAILSGVWAGLERDGPVPEPAATPPPLLPAVRPVTSTPGAEMHPSLSPDGLRLAFIGGTPSTGYGVWLQDLAADTPVSWVPPRPDRRPAFPTWSPDGRRLAWAELTTNGVRLVVRRIASGSARTVAELTRAGVAGLAWSPTADLLAVAVRRPGAPVAIELLDLEDGQQRPLTRPAPTSEGDFRPAFSPDGRRLAYVHARVEGIHAIYVADLESGRSRRLTFFPGKVPGLAWAAGGIVFNRFLPADRRGFWRLDPDSGSLVALPIAARFPVQVTAAARRLAFADAHHRGDLFVLTPSAQEAPRALAPSSFWDASPQPSPDGSRVAFASLRSGSAEIWLVEMDGAPPRRLTGLGTRQGGFTSHPRWSPDGRRLAFDSRDQDESHIYVLDVDAAGPPRRITAQASDALLPSWSLDGRRLYFASNRTGAWQVWSRSLDGGAPRQESRDGGFFAAEDPADGSLVWTRRHEPGLWRRPPDAEGPPHRWAEMPAPAFWGGWVLFEDHLIVAVRQDAGHRLERIDRRTGARKLLAEFDPRHGPGLAGPVIGATGAGQIVYSVFGQGAADLMWVEL